MLLRALTVPLIVIDIIFFRIWYKVIMLFLCPIPRK
jgi:hypothetical protein